MALVSLVYTDPATGAKNVRFESDGGGTPNYIQIVKLAKPGATEVLIGDDTNPLVVGGAPVGSLTETAPGTDTASSGLNGRLQRLAQRITSLISLLPSSLSFHGVLRVALQGYGNDVWTKVHEPAANTVASASQASAGGGIKNVCTSITATISSGGTAPTAVNVAVRLRDGAGGTILWAGTLALPNVAGGNSGIAISNLWIPGTAATLMVLEFAAAGGLNTTETLSMTGTTTT